MSFQPELYLHIKTLNFLGLISCYCHKTEEGNLFIDFKTNIIRTKATFYFVQIACSFMIIYCILYTEEFYMSLFTETGNHHSVLVYLFGSFVILSVYGFFYINHTDNIQLLIKILKYYNELQSSHQNQVIRKYFVIYAITSMLNLGISIKSFTHAGISLLCTILYIVLHSSITIVLGITISLYLTIVKILEMFLKKLNTQLKTDIGDLQELRKIIRQRNCILLICQKDLNRNFGLMILLAMGYVLVSAPSAPFVLISFPVNELPKEYRWLFVFTIIIVVIWCIPFCIIFIVISKCSGLTREVI